MVDAPLPDSDVAPSIVSEMNGQAWYLDEPFTFGSVTVHAEPSTVRHQVAAAAPVDANKIPETTAETKNVTSCLGMLPPLYAWVRRHQDRSRPAARTPLQRPYRLAHKRFDASPC